MYTFLRLHSSCRGVLQNYETTHTDTAPPDGLSCFQNESTSSANMCSKASEKAEQYFCSDPLKNDH